MDFETIKEMEALFKYVSSNIYYIYVSKSSIFFKWAFVETLNHAWIQVKIVFFFGFIIELILTI